MVADHTLLLRPDRRRSTIVFWTCLGGAAILVSLASLLRPVLHLGTGPLQLGPWPWLGVLGLLLVLHVQLVYATRLRLSTDAAGLSFRNLLGTRRVAWTDILAIDEVSALAPAGRGGNISGLRLRTRTGDVTIPDVFPMRRAELRRLLLSRSPAPQPNPR